MTLPNSSKAARYSCDMKGRNFLVSDQIMKLLSDFSVDDDTIFAISRKVSTSRTKISVFSLTSVWEKIVLIDWMIGNCKSTKFSEFWSNTRTQPIHSPWAPIVPLRPVSKSRFVSPPEWHSQFAAHNRISRRQIVLLGPIQHRNLWRNLEATFCNRQLSANRFWIKRFHFFLFRNWSSN